MTLKTRIFTHHPRVSLTRFTLCWWRHNRLAMTSQWPDNCDANTWQMICNSLDIDFFHGDIHGRSCKNNGYDCYWIFLFPLLFILTYTFRLSETRSFWFCNYTPPWMFLSLIILFEYWIEHITFGLLCIMFRFSSRIYYRGPTAFVTDCPCDVWCCGLTTCLLYVGPLFGNLVWNHSRLVSLTLWRTTFSLFLIMLGYMYLHISQWSHFPVLCNVMLYWTFSQWA